MGSDSSYFLAIALAVAAVGPVAEAAPRTFVASHGADINPCTLAAPCRTFANALVNTDQGGEIIALDSAGYGIVQIAQSVSIIAPPGIHAAITVPPAQHGITIMNGPQSVRLTGLHIVGRGGLHGIDAGGQGELFIDNCSIESMVLDGIRLHLYGLTHISDTRLRANSGAGVHIEGNGGLVVGNPNISMLRLDVKDNGASGIWVDGPARVNIVDSVLAGNGGDALSIGHAGQTEMLVTLARSSIVSNGGGVRAALDPAGGSLDLAVTGNTIADNGIGVSVTLQGAGALSALVADNVITRSLFEGIVASGAGATLSATRNRVTRNAVGIRQVSGSIVRTTGNNVVSENVTDVDGTLTTLTPL